ncbi:HAMP domain-containing sensor histidine kinase [Dehalobacterium formicoaceticum]|uniref:histidine kinase n=1 Tax=Dehalobacterium formicoaceticum TaxID=51515 RepID=A0ABT1Y4D5_9FIRM|nr:HAMP domain-containing sensor histidine kinase [Dehalobacterium formicoaceticum]MCR6545734.1 HAMP domain-containing histidine kinase [Dehalobacterium formicoaceticum]
MDIRWKKYSHSLITKIIVFIIAILSFTTAITIFANYLLFNNRDYEAAFQESYFLSTDFPAESSGVLQDLRDITQIYQSEEHILNGGAIREDDLLQLKDNLFLEFRDNSRHYNPNFTEQENYKIFVEEYAAQIAAKKNQLVQEQVKAYQETLRRLENQKGIFYYAHVWGNEVTNSQNKSQDYFQSFPAYIMFDGASEKVFPEEIKDNNYYFWFTSNSRDLGANDVLYVGFSDEFLSPRIAEWQENKIIAANNFKKIAVSLILLGLSFIYLVIVIGRSPEEEGRVQINFVDRIYNDVKLAMCGILIISWFGAMVGIHDLRITYQVIFAITLIIGSAGLVLVLSLIKSIKIKNFIKHSLTFVIFYRIFHFFKDVYDSGSTAVKVLIVVIGYPLLVAATFFIFPVTIGAAVWLAHQKVKEYNAIKEGVQKVKEGDLHYNIQVPGNGELARLASDINSITDGLNRAVANEVKSERLKTELITNVSHDIRTPLTSIITYVDLLKNEKDEVKTREYIEILEQKAERLKVLTDDLFDAAKASSGSIPTHLEKIELISLITQGLGEIDDKIRECNLDFKLNHPKDKVYIKADGRLFWRAVENLFSNIFKYAQSGSRVYIEISEQGNEVTLTFKNISAYELNISAEELMERFTRGDDSRSNQGSGLGLSIAKSLIELQKGSFKIEIDGDLFKAMIQIPKWQQ